MFRKLAVVFVAALVALAVAAPLHADAAAVYKAKCAMCHGEDGAGQTAMGKKLALRALSSAEVQKKTDAQLGDVITKGKDKMPAYGGKIADADIKALVAYVRTFAKK